MKQNFLLCSFLVSALFFANESFAVPTLSGEVNGDEFFPDGVLLEDVELPEDPNSSTGTSSVTIEGTGTVTVGNQRGGGFPRLTVVGGTKIESVREYDSEIFSKTWWDGQFTAPGTTRLPDAADVTFDKMRQENSLQIVEAFAWGLANEEFKFNPAAKVVLPVDEIDGQKLWIAYSENEEGDDWTVDEEQFCIVENGLCFIEVDSVRSLALAKELFQSCPKSSITNGKVSSAPTCLITCDRGFELNEDGDGCQETEVEGSEEGGESGEGEGSEEGETEGGFDEFESEIMEEERNYEFPSGYFRYQGTSDQRFRYLDEEDLTGEDLERVRSLNRSYLSRNARTKEEQLEDGMSASAGKSAKGEKDDNFLNYLIQMRNTFGAGNSKNVYTEGASSENGEVATGEISGGETENGEAMASSAPLLPSTGPELFAVIAVVGLLMMLFGARRQN